MSTLNVANIQSLTTSSAPSVKNSAGTEIGQYCNAFINFDGSGTVAIRDSFNVTSLTDNGTGNYSITYTNAMPDVNYSAVLSWNIQSVNNRSCGHDNSNYLTTGMRVTIEDVSTSYGGSGSRTDCSRICIAVFRGFS